jgi:hypothetical protein
MFSYDSESPLSTSEVRGCYLCKLYFVSYGRNAYNWTWTEKYPGDGAFHKTREAAQQHAEAQRVQGSRFYIDEIPALAFPITTSSLVVTEINTSLPFERYLRGTPKSRKATDIANYFKPWRINTIRRFFVEDDISVPFLPLRRSYSRSVGAYYKLNWIDRDVSASTLDLKCINATASRLQRWLTARSSKSRGAN